MSAKSGTHRHDSQQGTSTYSNFQALQEAETLNGRWTIWTDTGRYVQNWHSFTNNSTTWT